LKGETKMNLKTKLIILFSLAVLVFSTTACKNEGEAEKAGKKIDKAIGDLKK
jgi:hypothetical protein